MKAIHCTRYGPPEVLELREGPPPQPKDKQILISMLTGLGADRVTDYRTQDCRNVGGRKRDAAGGIAHRTHMLEQFEAARREHEPARGAFERTTPSSSSRASTVGRGWAAPCERASEDLSY